MNKQEGIDFDIEEVIVQLIREELQLIISLSKHFGKFYIDQSFKVYDLIVFLNDGYDGNYIDQEMLEQFCLNYNIEMTYVELKILLDYFKADEEGKISYNQLKFFFKTFVLPLDESESELFTPSLSPQSFSYIIKNQNNHKNLNSSIKSLGPNAYKNLYCFLTSLMQLEKVLYLSREKISKNSEVVPIELFYVFDKQENNGISKKEFQATLYQNFNINATNREIGIIFHNYAKRDGFIMSYDEFKRILLPFYLVNKKEKDFPSDQDVVSIKSREELNKLFQFLITFEEKINNLKLSFIKAKEFSPYERFLDLRGRNSNAYKKKKIDKEMLYKYLILNSQGKETIDEMGLDLIFNRMDWDEDNLISYDDFAQAISPAQDFNL